MVVRARGVRANGLEFGLLETGSGPLALCLHGFPDSAHTWRHLLPALAGVGFHAVAPVLRGYAPTAVPDDGRYGIGALVADAVALHQVLDGDGDAVLIGHDWGAEAAYGAAAFAPERWQRVVTLGVPPAALDPVLFGDYQQLKRSFYQFWFRDSLARAVEVVAADGMAFLDRLWQDWSPGYDAAQDLARVKESLRQPANLQFLSAKHGYPPPVDEVHDLVTYVRGHRDDPGLPFEVVLGGASPTGAAGARDLLGPLIEAGATWWDERRPMDDEVDRLEWLFACSSSLWGVSVAPRHYDLVCTGEQQRCFP